MTTSYITILLMLLIALGLAAAILTLGWLLGRRRRTSAKLTPYESGVPLLDVTNKRINVRFYQIAMLFILFDIEAAFLYPWAVIYRDATVTPAGLAWFALAEMVLFIVLLGVGYVYVWKKRAFDWK
jgi:NADH-quinone oxidoreductase subunit A